MVGKIAFQFKKEFLFIYFSSSSLSVLSLQPRFFVSAIFDQEQKTLNLYFFMASKVFVHFISITLSLYIYIYTNIHIYIYIYIYSFFPSFCFPSQYLRLFHLHSLILSFLSLSYSLFHVMTYFSSLSLSLSLSSATPTSSLIKILSNAFSL